jgi:uncharacterized protein YciI
VRVSGAEMTWQSMLDYSREHELLAKQLYVVFSEPTNGLGPIMEVVDEHVRYQTKLELDGVMWAAGPMATPDEQEWLGDGLFMYRASSVEEATRYAEADPMHKSGARTFRIRPWLLNEGSLTVRVLFSGGKPQVQ